MTKDKSPDLLHTDATQGESDMARIEGLVRRGNRWAFRRRVPRRLRHIIGKTEIVASLGDVSRKEAVRLVRYKQFEADAAFTEAERKLAPRELDEHFSDSEIIYLSQKYLRALEEEAPQLPLQDSDREGLAEINNDDLALVSQSVEDATIQATTLRFAESEGVPITQEHPKFLDLCAAMQRAEIEYHNRLADRLAVRPVQQYDPYFSRISIEDGKKSSLTLQDAVDAFLSAPERSNDAVKTSQKRNYQLAFFIELFGSQRLLDDISRRHVRDAQKLLLELPTNFRKRFPDLRPGAIVARVATTEYQKLSPQTAKRYIDALDELFRWLIAEGLIQNSPAANLKFPRPSKENSRRPFSSDQLNRLFASEQLSQDGNPKWVYWMPRIALFSGMRLNEIAGLKVEDILERDGLHFSTFDLMNIEHSRMRALNAKSLSIRS